MTDLRTLLYEALERWNIDQEIGSSDGLREWINEFLGEFEITEIKAEIE